MIATRPAAATHPVTSRLGRPRLAFVLGLAGLGLLIVLILVSATLGPARLPVQTSAGVLLALIGLPTPWGAEATEIQRQIVLAIRLPRILTAVLVGAGLALAGTVMQALFRNPMADPGIVGVSAGGALGAVVSIASGVAALQWFALPALAFAGALCAAVAVFLFSLRRGHSQVGTLLLAGIAVTYLCSALTTAIISVTYERDTLREVVFWLLGGFDNRGWEHVWLLAPLVALGAGVFFAHARALNLLALGEEEAQSLGLRVQQTRGMLLIAAALTTGAAVAVSGLVGFVGLVVPHAVRLLVRSSDHRLVLPLAALGGALFLLAADTLARLIIQPAELRVGVVTSLIGAPLFLWLLSRPRREAADA